MYRTHTCGELRAADNGKNVTLSGWVSTIRKFGGATFIDLRDRYGVTQLVFESEQNPALSEKANKLGREYVVQVRGIVQERSNKNPNLPTGDIEIKVEELDILNESPTPPFTIEENTDGGEELRMRYRYLDLRRAPMQRNMMLRHKLAQASRQYLAERGFLEIETPFLIKSTPEGARDFIVPSRMHRGQWYALPQSPQTFKQILMMAGYDRYFQIVKCFRDEDFRADRQPEFTQVDCEMAFVHQEDVIEIFTGFARHIFREVVSADLGEIPVITYDEAMRRFGSDKPDTRFGMELKTLDTIPALANSAFPPFTEALQNGGHIVGLTISGGAGYTRKQIDAATDFVKTPAAGLKGLAWVKWNADDTISSGISKFFDNEALKSLLESSGARPGDMLLIGAGQGRQVYKAMGDLRLQIGKEQNLRPKDQFSALWVVDFPMFSHDEASDSWTFEHHPFTSPKAEHLRYIHTDKGRVLANAYDFVVNGWECCSGSIRIHDREMQAEVFRALGMSEEETKEKFGFLLGALEYGAPPHGGCAFGFDRLAAIMSGTDSIRDVIAFPKNNAGRDLMLDAPAPIEEKVLKELGVKNCE